jgi:pimeloyl-ACP methyl ester carboxylesterase
MNANGMGMTTIFKNRSSHCGNGTARPVEPSALPRLHRRGAVVRALLVGITVLAAPLMALSPTTANAASGDLLGTVNFSQQCGGFQGISVGLTFDGSDLWYSCAESTPDLFRADPTTGQVLASYTVGNSLGALAYDAIDNVIYAGWGVDDAYPTAPIYRIQLDSQGDVTGSSVALGAPAALVCGLDDGLAYDGSNATLYVSDDCSTSIYHYDTAGNLLSSFPWAGSGCYNSGLALGNQLLFEGADGCNTVYVVSKSAPSAIDYQFSTAVAGDPNFRDEGLSCDTTTFPGFDAMWSKEAYSPNRAHAFEIPSGSCGVGGQSAIPPGPRPIIFIPGITGSYLKNQNGMETWPQAQAIAGCVSHFTGTASCDMDNLKYDSLASDGTTIGSDGPTYNVAAANGIARPLDGSLGGAIDSLTVNEFLWVNKTTHYYDITAQNVKASGYTIVQPTDDAGLTACATTLKCWIPVGVDWRKSAAYNATQIIALIDRVIALTGTDRVDLMAHSQGGLIANAIVHDPTSVGKIHNVVTMGTPWLGTPKLLSVLLYQEPCLIPVAAGLCALDPGTVQTLIKNYPGTAELNPSIAYWDAAPYYPLLITTGNGDEVGLSGGFSQGYALEKNLLAASPINRDTSLIDAANAWHNSVDEWSPLDPSVHLMRAIGYDAADTATCNSAPCSASTTGEYVSPADQASQENVSTETGVDILTKNLYYDTGDGTVELYSANLFDPAKGFDDRNGGLDEYYCGIGHQGLSQNTQVWKDAQAFLEDKPAAPSVDQVRLSCPDGTDGSLTGIDLDSGAAGFEASQGALLSVSGGGFAPGTPVILSLHSSPVSLGTATADLGGNFSIVVGLPPSVSVGDHQLIADGTGATGASLELSTTLDVSSAPVVPGKLSTIAGTVVDAASTLPLSGICVQAFPAGSAVSPSGEATTDASGGYRITGLAPGSYDVEFAGCGSTPYAPAWYSGAAAVGGAETVTLSPGGEADGVDAALVAATPSSNACVGEIANTTVSGDLTVPSGAVCVLLSSTVLHDVDVQGGGALLMSSSTVKHDLVATGAAWLLLAGDDHVWHDANISATEGVPSIALNGVDAVCDTTVGHDLVVSDSSSQTDWIVGDVMSPSGICAAANSVGHDAEITGNSGEVDFSDNNPGDGPSSLQATAGDGGVAHDLYVTSNSGIVIVEDDTVGHDATCSADPGQTTDDPTNTANSAGHLNSCG